MLSFGSPCLHSSQGSTLRPQATKSGTKSYVKDCQASFVTSADPSQASNQRSQATSGLDQAKGDKPISDVGQCFFGGRILDLPPHCCESIPLLVPCFPQTPAPSPTRIFGSSDPRLRRQCEELSEDQVRQLGRLRLSAFGTWDPGAGRAAGGWQLGGGRWAGGEWLLRGYGAFKEVPQMS